MAVSYRYFFILGNTPILSSAEIVAVFSRMGIAIQWLSISKEVAIVETRMPLVATRGILVDYFGGSVKIGRMLPDHTTVEQWVRGRHCKGAPCNDDKGRPCRIVVGVSVYKAADGVSNAKCDETLRVVRGEILYCKRVLKEEGKALRLVTGRERALPSVALVTEHILERGGELVALLSNNGEIQLGETLAVQAFHEYRHRDMGRPGRDARRGMLPPKVAQIMVNLAGVRDGGTILDPFCGSGTVLSEAALLGYNVVGSDIAEAAVEDAQKNFQFLISNFQSNSNFQFSNYKFFVSDVRKLTDHLKAESVDAIVTEPYLGPPLTGHEPPALLGKVRRDVQALVTDAFKAFDDVLCPSGRVVIVLPVLGMKIRMPLVDTRGILIDVAPIEKLGWRLVNNNIPRSLSRGDRNGLTFRNTILYGRDDQHLAREITVWTR